MLIFFSFWGCGCKDIQEIQWYIPVKAFGNLESILSAWTFRKKERPNNVNPSSHIACLIQIWQNFSFFCTFELGEQIQNFQKLFGRYHSVLVKYLCNCRLKTRTKNFKKNILISATLNYRNYLDASPLLKKLYSKLYELRTNVKSAKSKMNTLSYNINMLQ